MKLRNSAIVARVAGKCLIWDTEKDRAVLGHEPESGEIESSSLTRVCWSGSLLPAFEIASADGRTDYVKASVASVTVAEASARRIYHLALSLDGYGSGSFVCEETDWGLRFSRLEVSWLSDTRVISLQYGTRLMTDIELARAPRLDHAFWPDWSSEGYCVPAAGSSPTHSFWRSWDMGDARLPLGSYGDAMGTPYAAAFPRPMYAAAMGGRDGWLAFGPGDIPDAPLTLQLQSVTACLHYSYREDLWTSPDLRKREWIDPLRLTWADTGYEALLRLYTSFGPFEPKSPRHARSFICTWGDFKEGRYDLKRYKERVSSSVEADMIILDDRWETYNGSGEPDLERFPDFEADLDGLREQGYDIAVWQSIGWLDNPEKSGLSSQDLLCGLDGVPRQWRWSGNPIGEGGYHYLLDPSSERTRQLIVERTQRLVRKWRPAALKLDFGYGYPGPDVCVPRDPAYRGERLAYSLLKLTYEAAKAIDPDISIIYYGIHPLMRDVTDLINMDDLGDAGDSAVHEIAGHNQRCLWASLAASHGMPINTSTGYYWDAFGSILLDTAVVGVNGLTIGEFDNEGNRITDADKNRWAALQTWHRRTCGWKPLWLEADTGSLKGEPKLVSWGRIESLSGRDTLTSLVLRNDRSEAKGYDPVPYIRFTGQWALISLDDRDLAASNSFVCIPFSAGTLSIDGTFTSARVYGAIDGHLTILSTLPGSTSIGEPELRIAVSQEDLSGIAGFVIARK
ncbi:hypothetical protein [Cohnella herbarum]|uniref:Alpha-galactosidase n=1 Tax=Cohnella herbarum TaxID=2728023 RepID=A0A7Z2VP20_9BACL|nr:hypothetical protein [Cohnella herbarum]QJD86470.1 hypothetical protein HH215_27105 [Cohnella herbarum]